MKRRDEKQSSEANLAYLEWFNLYTTLVLLLEGFCNVFDNHVGDIVSVPTSLEIDFRRNKSVTDIVIVLYGITLLRN